MIPKRFITQWMGNAPWKDNAQIEQDLVISRALAEIYNNETLRNNFIFRGGTALNKIFFKPGIRYSEDIDLVQYRQAQIGPLMTLLRQILDPWLGKPKYKQSYGRVTFYYNFLTEHEPIKKMKLKIEINTREHGSQFDIIKVPFKIENGWFSADTTLLTYCLEELMATKMRAFYQRRKGRDLFDLYQVLTHYPMLDISKTIQGFINYLAQENLSVSRAEFEQNMLLKAQDNVFKDDIYPLLSDAVGYDQKNAFEFVHQKLISNLPGNSWEGFEGFKTHS